jgi:hypothetical protein
MTDAEEIADMVDLICPIFEERNVYHAFAALSVVVGRLLLAATDDKADAEAGVHAFKRRVLEVISDPDNKPWQTATVQ